MRVLQDSGFEVLGTTADARDLIRMDDAYRPDVVIADIQMPPDHGDDGLRAVLAIRSGRPGVGVLVLSSFSRTRTCSTSWPTALRGLATC